MPVFQYVDGHGTLTNIESDVVTCDCFTLIPIEAAATAAGSDVRARCQESFALLELAHDQSPRLEYRF